MLMFSPRIPLKNLADLSRRLATALQAGLDARSVWQREAECARGRGRGPVRAVSESIAAGGSLADSLAAAGGYFPTLFRELAAVGEAAGREPEVFAQLAEHYQQRLALRRQFLGAIAWPMAQLGIAIAVIGLLIWFLGFINQGGGPRIDPLGFGLIGERGLAIYLAGVAVVAGLIAGTLWAIRRGVLWTRPIQRLMLRLPVVGPALRTLALGRIAWAMHLTFHTGMDPRRALRLSLQSAGNARFQDDIPKIDERIAAGESVYAAFLHAGHYPNDFLDTLAVAEQSGRLSESLAVLAEQYRQRAQFALTGLTAAAGFCVWAMVAAIIIVLIFRIFGFYLGAIRDAAKGI